MVNYKAMFETYAAYNCWLGVFLLAHQVALHQYSVRSNPAPEGSSSQNQYTESSQEPHQAQYETREFKMETVEDYNTEETSILDQQGVGHHTSTGSTQSFDMSQSQLSQSFRSPKQKGRAKCPYCDLTLVDGSRLNRHVMSVHLKTRAFKCPYCDCQSFKRKDHLMRHIRQKHPTTLMPLGWCVILVEHTLHILAGTEWEINLSQCMHIRVTCSVFRTDLVPISLMGPKENYHARHVKNRSTYQPGLYVDLSFT